MRVLGLVALVAGCAPLPVRPSVDPEPAFTRLSGEAVPWSSLRAPGRPTLLAFATLWCEACRRERPALTRWAAAHRPRVETLYVFSGAGDGEAALAEQVRALELDPGALTVLLDASGSAADAFRINATPTLLVLDAEGRVTSTHHRLETVPEP